MAEATTVARPYAEAVFAHADATRSLAKWSQALFAMAAVAAHPDIRAAIGNPRLTSAQLYGLFAAACGDLDAEMQNLVRALLDNGRLELMPQIRDIYEALKNQREEFVDAVITSAFPLDDAQTAMLVAELEQRFRLKVKPQVRVDGGLIGGVRMQVGDEVIDGSVRGKLAAMSAALMK